MRVFHSSSLKEPTEKQHDQMWDAPTKFLVQASHKNVNFKSEQMYLSFYSFQGSSITVTVSFPVMLKVHRHEELTVEELKEQEKQAKLKEKENQELVKRRKLLSL